MRKKISASIMTLLFVNTVSLAAEAPAWGPTMVILENRTSSDVTVIPDLHPGDTGSDVNIKLIPDFIAPINVPAHKETIYRLSDKFRDGNTTLGFQLVGHKQTCNIVMTYNPIAPPSPIPFVYSPYSVFIVKPAEGCAYELMVKNDEFDQVRMSISGVKK